MEPTIALENVRRHLQDLGQAVEDDDLYEIEENLGLRQGIPLLCQYQVTLKAFLILLRTPVFFNQFVAYIQLSAWLVIAFRHGHSPRSFVCIIPYHLQFCKVWIISCYTNEYVL